MNWDYRLIEPGYFSVVPYKLLIGFRQLKMTAKQLLAIIKINRHRKYFNLHNYYLDDPNKVKNMSESERKKVSDKIGKIIKSCVLPASMQFDFFSRPSATGIFC